MIAIVLGTGRCGTKSMVDLLDAQGGWQAVHELRPLLPWAVDLGLLESRVSLWNSKDNFCEAGFYFLPYTSAIIQRLENKTPVRFICLRRNLTLTVTSYLRKTDERPDEPPRNHWVDHEKDDRWRPDPRWDNQYPTYKPGMEARGDYIRKYYWDYYDRAYVLNSDYPQFRVFDMEHALNTKQGQEEVLVDFLGISEPVYSVGIKSNQGGSG